MEAGGEVIQREEVKGRNVKWGMGAVKKWMKQDLQRKSSCDSWQIRTVKKIASCNKTEITFSYVAVYPPIGWTLTRSQWNENPLLPRRIGHVMTCSLTGWLAMPSQFILMFWASKIKWVRQLKCVIQSGRPAHVNAAVINYFAPTVSDVLSLHFLSISFSALLLLYFISPYYEESVKSLAMKWAIHAWLKGIKKALCRPQSPFLKCV